MLASALSKVLADLKSFQEGSKDDHSVFERGKGNSRSVEVRTVLQVGHFTQKVLVQLPLPLAFYGESGRRAMVSDYFQTHVGR